MAERYFQIRVDRTERQTATYGVYAESFEDARRQYDQGYADFEDDDTYDSDEDIEYIECGECGGCDECDCDSEDASEELDDFMASL